MMLPMAPDDFSKKIKKIEKMLDIMKKFWYKKLITAVCTVVSTYRRTKCMVFLIVEDSRPARNLIKSYVSEIDIGHRQCDFIEVENGETAWDIIQTRRVEFVFCDWNLSTKMTGLDVLKTIRNDPRFKELPIMMVTSESDKLNVVEALKYGASGFIVKPINKELFMEKALKVINNSVYMPCIP
jgi:two-component system chemotaxis response regulator CheY